jgi:hypothetical protein
MAERRSRSRKAKWVAWAPGVLLGLLPVASFVLQYALSAARGTEPALFRHFTVTYIDWIFVPFNLVVVQTIDWRRGARISLVAVMSLIANIAGHAIWQYNAGSGGHMISREQIVLPAGWVHLGFSVIEGTLLLAFVFARKRSGPFNTLATALAVVYFVGAGVSGFVMNHGFIATDAIMVTSGIFLVTVYPYFKRHRPVGATG